MTTSQFDLRQMVRLNAAKRVIYPDVALRPGQIERINRERREITVWWPDRGVRINLAFDDVEAV